MARLAAELEHERETAVERAAGLAETREQLAGEFARLSTQALQQNNAQFLELADTKLKESRQAADGELAHRQEAIEQLLKPISEQLGRYEEGIQRLEVERQRAYTTLTEQMKTCPPPTTSCRRRPAIWSPPSGPPRPGAVGVSCS